MSSSSGTPSPSPSAQSFSSTPFYVPGPSSHHNHSRPRPKTHHSRPKSTYTPVGPVLSTEKRAHRRAHTQKSSISSLKSSSSASEYSRSPLSRFSSYSASMAAQSAAQMPHTPAKSSRRSSSIQNSPFSDYFTDEARSVDTHVSSSETKQLLVRMNKLQSQLMRDHSDSGREAINIVGRKLSEIELELNALHSQTRLPLEIEDSAVFMDEEQDRGANKEDATPNGQHMQESYLHGMNASMEMPPEPVTIEQFKAERDWFIIRMQDLLEDLGKTQVELSKRYAEVRELNDFHNVQIEDRETQLEQLRSENEGLRSDLGFEYSELLFLKLQMKSLEVDVDAIGGDDPYAPATEAQKAKTAKKNRILSEMDRWRSDWQDVDARFKRRRSKYGVSLERRDSVSVSEAGASTNGEADWHIETVKEGRGRVTSLTIKRMGSSGGPVGRDVTAEEAPTSRDLDEAGAPQPLSPTTTTNGLDGQTNFSNTTTTSQGSSEPQIATSPSPPDYQEHGTQTDFPLLLQIPTSQDEEDQKGEDLFDEEEEVDQEEEKEDQEDCAITTSSEGEEDDDEEDIVDVEEEDEVTLDEPIVSIRAPRTAWQELWSSLANLSGLPDEDDD